MSAFSLLISPIALTGYLLRLQNVLLPSRELFSLPTPTASVLYLRPDTFSVIVGSTSELLRFLQRMAASKPTSWLSSPPGLCSSTPPLSSFPTQYRFGDLSVWSGLFPSRPWTFAPGVCLPIGPTHIILGSAPWYSEFP
jgi:hypothetical protein